MTFFKRLLKNIFRAAIKDHDGKFLRWQTAHDLVSRILRHAELRELWPKSSICVGRISGMCCRDPRKALFCHKGQK